MDTSTKTVGYKEGSGFTHAYNDEPITFYPMEAHQGIRDVRNVKINITKTLRKKSVHVCNLQYKDAHTLLICQSLSSEKADKVNTCSY